jgi:hypothetical protein
MVCLDGIAICLGDWGWKGDALCAGHLGGQEKEPPNDDLSGGRAHQDVTVVEPLTLQ